MQLSAKIWIIITPLFLSLFLFVYPATAHFPFTHFTGSSFNPELCVGYGLSIESGASFNQGTGIECPPRVY